MHQTYLLTSLDALKTHLMRDRALYQVVASPNSGDVQWQQVDSAELPLLHQKPIHSAKGFFFAEQEPMYVFDGKMFRETLPEPAPFVLFGVQSCDLMAIHYQDLFFEQDPYYQARRGKALLVGVDCVAPCEQGFCPTVDAGPSVRDETADLVLHPLDGQRWLLIVLSSLGVEALHGFALEPATSHDIGERWENISHCEQAFPDNQYLLDGINKINSDALDDDFWASLAIQCLGCSGCTTVCPTCSCFGSHFVSAAGPQKHESSNEVAQVRFWDSCLYEGFQREASYHNPSGKAGQRVRRFWYHKFSTDYLTEFGRYGCVGCGRCEQACPGVIGVHSVMKRVADHD